MLAAIACYSFFGASAAAAPRQLKHQSQFPSKQVLASIDKLFNANKFAEAASRSKEILKRYPKNTELLADVALASLYDGDLKTAQAYAEKTVRLDSRNHEAHWVLTNVYSSQGKLAQSTRELNLSMKYRSNKPCKPCKKNSKQNLDLLKSIQQGL